MKRKLIYSLLFLAFYFTLTGCASNSKNHHDEIVNREVSKLDRPTKTFSNFTNFKLEEMTFSEGVLEKKDKTTVAKNLEKKLQAKLKPMLDDWNNKNTGTQGAIVIKPELQQLRVVSAAARFWIGPWAGDSKIVMDLIITDGQSGEEIARPRISTKASATGGGWSMGATDKNLLNYVVDISYKYLEDNY